MTMTLVYFTLAHNLSETAIQEKARLHAYPFASYMLGCDDVTHDVDDVTHDVTYMLHAYAFDVS